MRSQFTRALLLAGAAVVATAGLASAASITLTQISTVFNSPIGIDYHEPTNSVIASVNYSSNGLPHNLERINNDGTHAQYSTLSGLTDELKIATVRSGNVGGFTTGDVFTGNGNDGQIVRVSAGGATVTNPWISLPGVNGLLRGSMYIDRTGDWGGDMVAVTTNGNVWRIKSDGTTSLAPLASVGTHLEGVMTVPNDAAKYGPLAGKIIAGAEGQNRLYAIDTAGVVTFFDMGFGIEDIDFITGTENFFGVNFGTSKILGAPASDFALFKDEILLTSEFNGSGAGLWHLKWNGVELVAEEFTLSATSAGRGQWEHVTFAPAGIREIPPIPTDEIPVPATLALLGAALAGLGWSRRRS